VFTIKNIDLYPLKTSKVSLETSPGREWLYQNKSNKKNLLITIGDSWTWGDSLGATTLDYNDKQTRYSQFYTNKLAEKLDCDWLMIAWCGVNNNWIIDQYKIIQNAINKNYYKNYNKVYVHVCLTELFREIRNISFQDLFNKNQIKNFDEFCKLYFEITVLNKLKIFTPITNFHLFSKNFWDIDTNCDQYNFVNDNWQQLLFEKANIQDNELLPALSNIGIDPLVDFLKKNKFKNLEHEFSKLLIKINKRIDNMISCPLNHKKMTKHPTAEGHQIWADYLYDYYKDL
jgi:hypothetical protein